MVTCRVKPFQLIDSKSIKDSNSKKVMLEDGLEDIKNLLDQEEARMKMRKKIYKETLLEQNI